MEDFCFKYLPREEFERLIFKVQQNRQDKEDELRWQQHLSQSNKSTTLCIPKELSIPLSDSSTEFSSTSDTETSPVHQKLIKNKPKVIKVDPINQKKKAVVTFTQHAKTSEAIVKVQLGIQSLLASIGVHLEPLGETQSDDDDEPTSARAAKLRHIRLSEFNARFRRNYIYPLQVEVEKTSELSTNKLVAVNSAPNNSTHQLALRSLEHSLTRAFQALQIFQRQCLALKELLSTPQLLDDLLTQLSCLSELSTSLGLHNEDLDNQRRTLGMQIAQQVLHEDMAQLGLATTRAHRKEQLKSKSTRYPPLKQLRSKISFNKFAVGKNSIVKKSTNNEKTKVPQARTQTWTKTAETEKFKLENSTILMKNSGDNDLTPIAHQQVQVCHPVNVQVLMMQHEPITLSAEKTEVIEASTQTKNLESRCVGTDVPLNQEIQISTDADLSEQQQICDNDAFPTLHTLANDPFTAKLQRAVLSELAGETNHLGPLIDQLLREEFL